MRIQHDLRIRAPDATAPWLLAEPILSRTATALRGDGMNPRRAATDGCAWLITRIHSWPLDICLGYPGDGRSLILRVRSQDPGGALPLYINIPLFGIAGLVGTGLITGSLPFALAGMVVGCTLGVSASRGPTLPRLLPGSGSRSGGAARRCESVDRLADDLSAILRETGLEVVREPTPIFGVDTAGVRATAGESNDEALTHGDTIAWTRRMKEALGAVP